MSKLIDITGKALAGEWGSDDETGNGIPVLRTTNFTNEGVVNYANVVTRTIVKKNLDEKFLRHGDIIIEKSGGSDKQPVGRVVFFDGLEKTYLFNNFTGLLRVRDVVKWHPRYVFYALLWNYCQGGTRPFENKTTGLHNLKTDDYVGKFEIRDMPYNTQVAVCGALDKVQGVIAFRKQQLSALDTLVKARFVEMFGAYKETISLSSVADVTGGLTKNGKRNRLSMKLPYLRVANVSYDCIDTREMLEIGLTDEEKRKTLLKYGDLLFVEGNGSPDQIGRVAIWRDEVTPCVHQNHLIKARFVSNRIIPIFAMHYFMTQNGRRQIKKKAVSTSGLYTLSVSKVADFALPEPPLDLQEQFAAFVAQVDKSKFCSERGSQVLQNAVKCMWNVYMGGRVYDKL